MLKMKISNGPKQKSQQVTDTILTILKEIGLLIVTDIINTIQSLQNTTYTCRLCVFITSSYEGRESSSSAGADECVGVTAVALAVALKYGGGT